MIDEVGGKRSDHSSFYQLLYPGLKILGGQVVVNSEWFRGNVEDCWRTFTCGMISPHVYDCSNFYEVLLVDSCIESI